MSTVSPAATLPVFPSTYPPIGGLDALGLEHCIYMQEDGVYADPAALGQTFMAAFEHVMRGNNFFTDIDYASAVEGAVRHRPGTPRQRFDAALRARRHQLRLARKALYKAVKLANGEAEYCFEPAEAPGAGASCRGGRIRRRHVEQGRAFGLDIEAVRAAIAGRSSQFVTVARRMPPEPGCDARIVEVSQDIHRSERRASWPTASSI